MRKTKEKLFAHRAMEPETIQKNGAILKSRMSSFMYWNDNSGGYKNAMEQRPLQPRESLKIQRVGMKIRFFAALALVIMASLMFTSCGKDDDGGGNGSLAGTGWQWKMLTMGNASISILLDFTSETSGKIKQEVGGQTVGSGTNFTYAYEYDGNDGAGNLYWSGKEFEFTVIGNKLTFEENAAIGDLYLGDAVFTKK